ncbi:MAG: Fe-S cluster assembly protein HesB [Candidatus Eremiobacteraeota bacterium]|nr:Fe-S cluster assembly protein HesB [Candidatus Eremiobacteraeota bacterium]
MTVARGKETYPFTPDRDKNALLAQSGTALLIGMCLDQQVRTEKAMSGPYDLRARLGNLDAKKIAALPAARLVAAFRRTPALHRYPGMMAKRVRALCAIIASEYHNDGARVWADATNADELYERFRSLPGFGDGKAATGVYILAKYGQKKLSGWRRYACEENLPWEFEAGKKVQR